MSSKRICGKGADVKRTVPAAVHRAIVCVDVEGFAGRPNPHQLGVRGGLYRSMQRAFARSGVRWRDCYSEDRGDGLLILVPPRLPKNVLAARLPGELAAALAAHNRAHEREARIRLRMALHAGEIHHDGHGVAGAAINAAFRMLEAEPLKRALGGSSGVLAVIASQWFFEEVIRHDPASGPASYRRARISVKETGADGWICLPDDPYPPALGAALPPRLPMAAVPRQLPAGAAGFAGRAAELEMLTGLLEQAADASAAVVISAIGGTAGIGKTAVAVHWAHQVAGRFPDGQLYVNLRGFDPAGPPMTPAEAVRGFLDAFEVPPERIPVSLDAQTALYRSLLAGRRALIVLDDARDAAQVRPLLPGTPGPMVVVTSRNQLTSLLTTDGAHPVTLDVLPLADARELLARRLGPARVAAEPDAAEQIIASCARLPLALAIVAARAATHPRFPLSALAGDLRDAHGRLEALTGGDPATDVRAVFSWSYRQLATPAARLFRLLGLHPGPDTSAPAAASLASLPLHQVRPSLAELARSHLLAEHTPGRYGFHDLLRAYAAELTLTHDPGAERRAAVHRLLDHYLHTAHTAAILLHPRFQPPTPVPPQPGAAAQELADHSAAWEWLDAEHPVLLAAIQLAASGGHHSHAWQLPAMLVDFFQRRGQWHDWAATQHTAIASAQLSADRRGQAWSHRGLGFALRWLGQPGEAHAHLQQALRLFQELGDQAGQAETHTDLGALLEHQGRPKDALAHAEQTLSLSRAVGYRDGEARALNNLGWYHALLEDPGPALLYCEQALTLQRELGDRRGEAHTLDSIGYAHHLLGRHQRAITHLQQALALKREIGDRHGQATALTHLGDAHHATGDIAAARDAWQQALDILDHLDILGPGMGAGFPTPDEIRTKLRQSDTPGSDAQPATSPR